MAAEKRCPHCNNWTRWNNQPADRCQHCNGVLDAPTAKLQLEWEQQKKDFEENNFYRIREGDGIFKILVRKAAMIGHAIFAAITWAFLWFTTTFAG